MDPAHVDALIGSATETGDDEEELVVVEERTDSGSPTSQGEYEEYEEFEEVSASSEGAAAPEQLEADFGETRGKLAAQTSRSEPLAAISARSRGAKAQPLHSCASCGAAYGGASAPAASLAGPTPGGASGGGLAASSSLAVCTESETTRCR